MTNRERFHAVMQFGPADRLPMVEWAGWWDKTIDRWRGEGLPASLVDAGEIREYLGLDMYRQQVIGPYRRGFPQAKGHGQGVVACRDDYEAVKEYLYPDPEEAIDREKIEAWAERQASGEMVVWISLLGFFWYPRTLFGIERHLYAFYEEPELMHQMNEDLVEYNVRVFEAFCEICTPDFMTFAEDMSYNNGPMISEDLFNTFMAPYYRRIVPVLREHGTYPFVDTDGEISQLVPWFMEVGVDGFLPLERQAGCDLVAMREVHPRARFIGAYDKMVMNQGEEAIRREFERLEPVMRQGGYIPSCDHQTPPGVSFQEYHVYLKWLERFCVEVAQGS